MTNQKPDPLVETLMQLAVSAAPLIRRARESGLFRTDMGAKAKGEDEDIVEATVVKPAAKASAPKADQPEPSADSAALQAILVRQALRISELEAELAALKAKARPAAKKRAAKKAPARSKST